MDKHITAPISDEDAKELRAGDYVYITGTIYTARDAAHKRMAEALAAGEPLPIDMKNNIIYYMGPSPAREGRPIGYLGECVRRYTNGGNIQPNEIEKPHKAPRKKRPLLYVKLF